MSISKKKKGKETLNIQTQLQIKIVTYESKAAMIKTTNMNDQKTIGAGKPRFLSA
jgi:hypothetical protein